MQVSSTNQVSSTTAASTAQTKATAPTLGYNQFLQLLIAQLKNQDPTAPADSTQFVSQLATFSSVEQSVQANAKLASILSASSLTEAEALVGRTLTSADGSVSGIVRSVSTDATAPTATLDTGDTIALQSGVRIS